MSLALFQEDNEKRLEDTPIVTRTEPGAWDGFFRGTGQFTMKGFAEAGRAVSFAASAAPVLYDAVNGGTEASDRYFKWHDDTFGDAVDYWTPKPGEVGMAGQVAGTLLSTLPMVIASPLLAVAKTQLSTVEDLTRAGVDTTKAQAAGAVQGLGFGVGVWLPILGKNLVQRVLVGGALANVVQGAATRGATGEILEGTVAEGQFKAFDTEQITLDVLLGLAFGTLAHLSPAQRAQGAEVWKRLESWGKDIKPSDVEALATLRQAQHLNADSLGGKPVDVTDIDKHVARTRKAIDQLSRDEPVNVDDMPAPRIEADPVRVTENEARFRDLMAEAERVRTEEGLAPLVERETGLLGTVKKGAKKVVEVLTKEDSLSDPLTDTARQFVMENPDLRIDHGTDAEGNPVTRSTRQMLDDADANVKKANEDANLFKVAASCIMGIA